MSRPNVLVTRPIMDEPLARLSERCDVTVHENEFGIPRDELLQVVAGRDAMITMLTEQVDAELLAAAGPAAEDRGEPRGRVRQRRRRRVHRRRRARHEHAGRADRDHGRHRVRAAVGGRSADRRGRAIPARADPVDLGAADDARPGRPPQDDRHRRLRADRAGGRAPGEGLRHDASSTATRCSCRPRSRPRPARAGSSSTNCSRRRTSSRSTRTSRPRRATCSAPRSSAG